MPKLTLQGSLSFAGIARLRYRAHTTVTALWFSRLNERGERSLVFYNGLIEENAESGAADSGSNAA
jgi:hypothetical protein